LESGAAEDGDRKLPRPNIVFFFIDDMGWTDLGCFGSKYYETPNIDRLCASGMKFTSAYSCGPNCAPTRACLMSGQYSPRHGIYTVGSGARGKANSRRLVPAKNRTTLDPKIVTLAESLKMRGYTTAHAGKWHLGAPPAAGPMAQGFDVNIGGDHRGHPPSYFSPYQNSQLPDGPKGEYLTDRLTDEALKFIDGVRKKPFFLYFAHYAVHTPIQAKGSIAKKFATKPPVGGHGNAKYAAMIASVDESVGRVLKKIDGAGLTSSTVFVFSSDNGGLGGYRRLKLGTNDVTDNAPLRGGKGMLYEGGVRVPLFVRWPGVTAKGSVCDVPVTSVDFYPTFCEITGAELPSAQVRDGLSFVSLLRGGGKGKLSRDAIYWHFPGYLQANTKRGTWRTTPAGALRVGDFKLIEFFEDGRLELYDLASDIGEKRNLAGAMPAKANEMQERLRSWRSAVNAPMPRPNPAFREAK
jgi:arylsulfatase A-like enzyme